MKKKITSTAVFITSIASILLLLPSLADAAGLRVKGALNFKAYGYEDAASENHLWLFQNTRFSLYQTGGPLSFHFSGGYLGDNADDFSHSGKARFLKGYLQYSKTGNLLQIRLGRFFLYRGVALGTLDGVEYSGKLSSCFNLALFAGMMGPLSREFEFENPGESFAGGGEIRFTPGKSPWGWKNSLALSFFSQNRENQNLKNRLGISTYSRINRNWNWMNTVHLRFAGSPIRKIISRLRYSDSDWNALFEGGIIHPDVEYYSWFADFEEGGCYRLRFALDRWLKSGKWGLGIEGGYLLAGDGSGFRGGPVLTLPCGQIGYRFSSGSEFANSSGPWASLRYTAFPGAEVYAYGSITTINGKLSTSNRMI